MASSSNPKRNYNVFLSFRGADICNNFLSHLFATLDQKGLFTFVDNKELGKGEVISPVLMRAIEDSYIAIVIFSENYSSSLRCLEEIEKIIECKWQRELIVLPVFYKVKPRDVRRQRNSYKTARDKHEVKFLKDLTKVQRLEKALFDAGNLSGFVIDDDSDEADVIRAIVKYLLIRLDRGLLDVPEYLVGVNFRVQEIKRLSGEASADNDVLMIGLWGPGGIGKTTISKVLYNVIWDQFDGCSFLAQVRETSNQGDGLVALQEKLLYEILHDKDLKVHTVDGGISLIRERLCHKKVLLLLDDVDRLDQLNALAGEGNWFGKGSRIIVTSRDKHLLTSHGINCVYEAQTLTKYAAQELFCEHAFQEKVEIRRDLIHGALDYASGLPLALEVLGSFLRGRKEPAWESTLHKLSKIPDQTINRVLKISVDGLEDNEREIFLDIACFFKGKRIEYIKEVLELCDFEITVGLEILIKRSLIKYEDGFLQMHDLVQLMGKDIVNKECPDDPGKRSRLWVLKDVQNVLCENTETDAIKAIVLGLPAPEEITISPDTFTNMKKLRILILHKVHISSHGPVCIPQWIRWLSLALVQRKSLKTIGSRL